MCFSQRLHRVFWFHAFWSVSTLTNSMCSPDHTGTFRNLTLKLRRTKMQLNQAFRNQSESVHGRSFVFCPLSSSPHHHRHPAPATDENQLRVPLGALYLNYLRKQGNTSWENVGRCWKIWFGVDVKLRFSCLEVQLDLWCKVPASTHHDTAWLWASIP